MKATELMIGDIVSVVIPRIVMQITKHKIGYHRTELPFGECKMTYARLADITPIPLTPEILEKNGWNDEMHRFYNDDTFCELDLRIDNGHYTWVVCGASVCSFTYVHELQHALRLCGLNDEADNFKVE